MTPKRSTLIAFCLLKDEQGCYQLVVFFQPSSYPTNFYSLQQNSKKLLWSCLGRQKNLWNVAVELCLETAFCLPSVLHFEGLNDRLEIHLELLTSISKPALQVCRTSYQTETQPGSQLPVSLCHAAPSPGTPVQHTALSNSVCRALLQSLLVCEIIFFQHCLFFLLTLVMTTILKRKGRLPSDMLRSTWSFQVCALL